MKWPTEHQKNILIELDKNPNASISQIYFKIDYSYTTISHTINLFEREGLIKTKKIGRERQVELTSKGKKVVSILSNFILQPPHPFNKSFKKPKQIKKD